MTTHPRTIIAFTHAHILDSIGEEPFLGTLVIENNTIISVGKGLAGALPDTARIIDLKGRYILPGLIDAHAHIICTDPDPGIQMRKDPVSLMAIKALGVLKASLDQGFTTLRDCGGADAGIRTAVDTGLVPGPRLRVSGRHLSMTGGHGDSRWPADLFQPIHSPATFHGVVVDGVDDCRKVCRDQLRQGIDFLKVMAGGGCLSPSDRLNSLQYSFEELSAMVWEATACGTYVSAHCYSDASILNCLASGIKTIEHGNLMTQKSAGVLKQKNAYLVPTLAAYHIGSKTAAENNWPDEMQEKLETAKQKAFQGLEAAVKQGCNIGSGSDILGPAQNNQRAFELELKAEVMGPLAAIKSATLVNAQMMGMDHLIGSLEAGKRADLIVVEKNPISDLSSLQNFEKNLICVMKDGQFHKFSL